MTNTDTGHDAVAIVLRRLPRQLAAEPFYSELISGIEAVLNARQVQVLMQVVDSMERELESYRHWAATGSIRAVLVADIVPDDPRPAALRALGLPAVIMGEPDDAAGLPAVRTDGYSPMREAVARLAVIGHTRIGRITGPTSFKHTLERTRGFLDAAAELGVGTVLDEGDYSAQSGTAATTRMLVAAEPPTAIIYDNDTMAIAGLHTARDKGIAVPDELSIVAWDDSQFCLLETPSVSAMSHDIQARGELAGRSLLAVIDGDNPGDVATEPPVFVARGSTGPNARRATERDGARDHDVENLGAGRAAAD